MDLKEIREKSNKILANFIDEIGLDGEFYASICNCPMEWEKTKANFPGEYVSPNSKKIEEIMQLSKYDEKTKEILKQRGLILINQSYKQKDADDDLYVTTIHETIHSNRNLLLFDVNRDNENEKAYSFNNSKFEQNTSEYTFSYVDASQEILKGNIDTSKQTIERYKNISFEKEADKEFINGERDTQMEKQQVADEALVELMSILSYKLYRNKENKKSTDIWKAIEDVRDKSGGNDIGAMCKIILKHHDLDLFNWMIDPITYSKGDIHFDFFGQYTKNDYDLLQELYEGAELDFEELVVNVKPNEINIKDMKEVATSRIAMEELVDVFQYIKRVQNHENKEYERE